MTDAPNSPNPVAPAAARDAVSRAASAVARAVASLAAADARTETLAEVVPERRVLGIPRAARMTAIGRVWRLGVLLLDADGAVYAAGRVVRAERPARKSITADAVAEQRALRAAAIKGGIPQGESVDFGAIRVDFEELARTGESGPLVLGGDGRGGGKVLVRWSPAQPDALIGFEAYLIDRADLLVHPPQGT
jgi:hypothetical protein